MFVENRHPNIPASVWTFICDLVQHPNITKIILFGSRAFGDHEERSDVDIAISGVELTNDDWIRLRDKATNTRSLYWISLVNLERNPAKLRSRIYETGLVIYEKETA